MNTIFRMRFNDATSSFFPDELGEPYTFADVLRDTRTIVGGAMALLFALTGVDEFKNLDNMVLFAPNDTFDQLTDYISGSDSIYWPVPPTSLSKMVCRWESFILNKTITIIRSHNESAFTPVFQQHFTCMMNCMTPDSFFCPYPLLTLRKKSFILGTHSQTNTPYDHIIRLNDSVLSVPNFLYIIPFLFSEIFDIKVSLSHRFDFEFEDALTPYWQSTRTHLCGLHRSCPLTIRTSLDTGSLFINFGQDYIPLDDVADIPIRCNGGHATVWQGSNHFCNGHLAYSFVWIVGNTSVFTYYLHVMKNMCPWNLHN